MKTVIIGDVHGLPVWKNIVHTENPDRVVFVGDYFDSFDINTEDQCNNFLDIVEYKKFSGKEVIMLVGNHDQHYIIEGRGRSSTAGFQQIGSFVIRPIINDNIHHLQMSYKFDNILCTHAGIGKTFMNDCFGIGGWSIDTLSEDLNELWKYKPKCFEFNGWDPYGDNAGQGPTWIRPKSLMRDAVDFKKKIIQVVGHTKQNQIDIAGKSTGGRYYFIDTLSTSGEYLIVEDGVITSKSYK